MNYPFSTHRFALVCSLVSMTSVALVGCGGGGEGSTPSAADSAPATPGPGMNDVAAGGMPDPGAAGMPGGEAMMPGGAYPSSDGGAGMPAPAIGMPGGEGYAMPGMTPGMPDAGYGAMTMDAGGMPGMPGFPGMPGMGMGQPGFVDPAPDETADYMAKAKYAFAIGKEAVAEQYLMAHMLTSDEEAPTYLQQIKWSPNGKKLATTLRFAVGVDLKAPANLTDIQPIGRSQFAASANGGGGDGMAAGMDPGMGGVQQAAGAKGKSFGDLTGKFGEGLLTAFETAWDNGDFGTIFKEIETIKPVVRGPNQPGMAMGMPGMGMPGTGFPDAGYDPGAAMAGTGQGAAAPTDASLRMQAVAGKAIVPGLLFLGTGSSNDLVDKAQKEGVDFLFMFDVNVKVARFVQNDTRIRLISVKDGGSLGATSTLKNLTVDKEMAQKGDSDDVTKQIGVIFKKVEGVKMAELPKLEPVHVYARLKVLIDKKSKDVLPALMECRVFNSLGLISDEERNAAYQLLLGGSGVGLLSSNLEDRQSILNPMLSPYK